MDTKRVMGYPDDMKLKSRMTLFELATPEYPEFAAVIDKFYQGNRDRATIDILKQSALQ